MLATRILECRGCCGFRSRLGCGGRPGRRPSLTGNRSFLDFPSPTRSPGCKSELSKNNGPTQARGSMPSRCEPVTHGHAGVTAPSILAGVRPSCAGDRRRWPSPLASSWPGCHWQPEGSGPALLPASGSAVSLCCPSLPVGGPGRRTVRTTATRRRRRRGTAARSPTRRSSSQATAAGRPRLTG